MDDRTNNEAHLEWLNDRHGRITSSMMSAIMVGIDDPKLLDDTQLGLALEGIAKLKDEDFSVKDGVPKVGPLNKVLEWSKPITAAQAKYAFNLKDGEQLPTGAQTYLKKVAVERMTAFIPERELNVRSIMWGREQEANAIVELSMREDIPLSNTGEEQHFFCDDLSGSTPDGVQWEDGKPVLTAEVKCPNPLTHAEYRINIKDAKTLKEYKPEYYWQVKDQMRHAGVQKAVFASCDLTYTDDDLQFHVIHIERDDSEIAKIEHRLAMAAKFIENYIAQVMATK